ncbi:MerR family transcriptional regulator [Mahella australiensis]|uniref:Regulatory protein MerR n=1 Tax=Mahella australiensis (strain DSM 15567 / CIP 107919 / 50-1 BON) TaxID=697281 RepID=F3ZXT1_MAHA5|nr:MerR family transcriptional regulator [Mahella australiensis]AEE96601.1 regulatory protein MerR [Mahella australiensis 50-1 BON]
MPDEKTYTISEVAKLTGYEPHVIRYYEKEFDLNIPRTKSNHRYFTYREIELLEYIKALQDKGFTNSQIKDIINAPQQPLDNEDAKFDADVATTDLPVPSAGLMMQANLNGILSELKDDILEEMRMQLQMEHEPYRLALADIADQIKELAAKLNDKDEDVLLSENAKLKMQVKQKAYEIASLKEELARERNKKRSLFSRLFKR